MKSLLSKIGPTLLVLTFALGLLPATAAQAAPGFPAGGKIVVANRGSGTISILSARSGQLLDTVALPSGENAPEPMYVVYSAAMNRVFVGDRANNRVVVFDARTFALDGTVEAGAGIFHMWADARSNQLWVNNDIDKTTTVIDPVALEVVAAVPTPPDLVAQGGFPHDVILDPQGRYAYVSILGLPGDYDAVVQFSTETFQEIGREDVGKDPHLSLARQNPFLYVASQGSNRVTVLDRETLALVAEIDVAGAHGAGMSRDGRTFYTTNLPGGGAGGLVTIDTRSQGVVGVTDAPYAVPHNIALIPSGRMIFVTHTGGSADKVSIYRTFGHDPVPVVAGEVTVGLNPFGLAYVP